MSLLEAPLAGASLLYGAVARARNYFYDRKLLSSYRCGLPVICAGNLTAGGNSKTPLCIFLAGLLRQAGHEPVVLSRGYGGKLAGPHVVEHSDLAQQVGDEPLMLRRLHGLKVVVARERVAGAQLIERERLGSCIIMDDGFQHRRLYRNLDLVCADVSSQGAVAAFLQGRVLPLGRFREDRDEGLLRADGIVFSARQPRETALPLDSDLLRVIPAAVKIFRSYLQPRGVFALGDGAQVGGGEACAFCSIASPQGFFQTLGSIGFSLQWSEAFPDHHSYSQGELESLLQRSSGRFLICTEKDAVKIPAGLKDRVHVLRVDLQVEPARDFAELVLSCLEKR